MAGQVDVAFAESQVKKKKITEYYGFDPDVEYVLRSRSRRYNQTTQGYYRFANGEALAPRMRADATEEQKWERGQRLAWFQQKMGERPAGYAIYARGSQPTAEMEPMWVGQDVPDEAALDDSGEVTLKWEAAQPLHAEVETHAAVERLPDDGSGPASPANVTPISKKE